MLKADFHIHTNRDPKDNTVQKKVIYSPYDIIDRAVEGKFDVLAFTHHDFQLEDKQVFAYAKKKGILLIPGIEKTINGAHVLILNAPKKQSENVDTFDDLRELRNKFRNSLIIAPHPYHVLMNCLRGKLVKHIDLFDAIEMSSFTSIVLDLNGHARKVAKKFSKPIVATSDSHFSFQFGKSYTAVKSAKTVLGVVRAVKKGNVECFVNPLSVFGLARIFTLFFLFELRLGFLVRFLRLKQ
ncbi:PHP domain-containing protein [Candidatus Woesearchaeota archaeon]|mgnify:CR=1 FL=1|jgi:predicted metal-dependent phosphoesterase TrpH|nr:PHP domain-containing protein [Candidatus Woesearchaeota archaeon]MBT3537026.1 PHP domain-containing protein [Candidatus Woesearchaeota archaeon]MBT4697636.1 PHP domain-containing protein [Candidatus Woesearchaeota archaeon]MBT4716897.1 PHP domain-containing protein [Candidatus Woesearchaeota archaeon]MBT7106664.1 PHP domain-containing protein [Candidatus Woesearchaeota archaeon]